MQERFVINIGRQFGSGGKSIGERLARRLGIRLYDKELINLAAEASGFAVEHFEQADEHKRKGWLQHLVGSLRTSYVGSRNPISGDALFQIQSNVIRRLAERESCIFVGRCADYILRDHPRSVSLFLTADDDDRIRRITARSGCSPDEARALMERIDDRRATYYNYYASRTWGVAATYDLTINTSRLGEEASAELIHTFIVRKLNLPQP